MARKPRLYVDGCAQHIIQRGNNRSACFYADVDYAFYLQKLKDAAALNHVKVHAFVLMTNHVDLLASGEDKDSIPDMMQTLGRSYVRYVHITYQRTGTLWEGRYKSSLVSTSGYLLHCEEYRNPGKTRAGRIQAYRKLFENQLPSELINEIRNCTNKGWVIGNDKFKQDIEAVIRRKVYDTKWGGDRKSGSFRKSPRSENQVT